MKTVTQFLPALFLLSGQLPAAEPQSFRSGPEQVALLELFSSEGCSSCPPAEAWLGRLEKQSGLWTQFVPVGFHVDYWDGLGWKDPFAKAAFTERQRSYASLWNTSSVYTPDVVWNGQDWHNWVQANALPASGSAKPGVLEANLDSNGGIQVRFHPEGQWSGGMVHAALLGSGLLSDVKRGENSGRKLPQDFVAMDHATVKLVLNTEGVWEAKIPALKGEAPKLSFAVWIEAEDRQAPVQATGGWLRSKL